MQRSEVDKILGRKTILELTPIKIKKVEKTDKICYFFDTDENASPFDINMAYDAGFDIVIPVSKISADKVPKLVQDAIFSRKPGASTTFFIGGSDVKEGEKIAEEVTKSLVPPFECPVIIDPRGSHTTGSAVVAMTMQIAEKEHTITNFKGKKVAIFGSGPVGRIASILAAKMGFNAVLVETWEKSSKQFVLDLAQKLNQKVGEEGEKITGEFCPLFRERYEVAKDADIIWSLAAAGIEILPTEWMQRLKGKKIVVDINLVPPYGIEGLKPKHKNEEIYPGIFGIGALALGRLKSNVESQILKEAAKSKGLQVFDYNYAFEVARKLLSKS